MTCELCELNEATVRVTVADLDGTVLDTQAVCRECANAPLASLSMALGKEAK